MTWRGVLLLLLFSVAPVVAAGDIPPAYRRAAQTAGVPPALLYAIALRESQANLGAARIRPWPWTLNIAGEGRYYRSRAAAQRALLAYVATGQCNVDIGLGQIHWCAHRTAFPAGPAQALSPYTNLAYAARFLKEQYRHARKQHSRGDRAWWVAVGRYHAPNHPARAAAYRRGVYALWLQWQGADHG